MPDRLILRRDRLEDGHEACVIVTPAATYHYDLTGGGFAHLIDVDGRDWISYRDGGGPAGEYRGIPNMVFRGAQRGYFHAGHRDARASSTEILEAGPERVVLESTSGDSRWQVRWTVDAREAHLQVLRSDADDPTYWFLYEGTPGGSFDPRASRCVRSTGESADLAQAWEAELASPAWVYFTDPAGRRSLYLQAESREPLTAMYRPMPPMTVFGFGRRAEGVDAFLRGAATLRVGLVDAVEADAVAAHIGGPR